jgi:muramidase (phage lysozyme)
MKNWRSDGAPTAAGQFSVLIASHSPSSGKGLKAKIFYPAYQANIAALRYLKAAQLPKIVSILDLGPISASSLIT